LTIEELLSASPAFFEVDPSGGEIDSESIRGDRVL
jgi:hypothetical protein